MEEYSFKSCYITANQHLSRVKNGGSHRLSAKEMMKMKWKFMHNIHSAMLWLSILILPIAAGDGAGWYCVRNREHRQPTLGGDLTWVEEYDGYYIDHAHGDSADEKVLYLTFDAGYENGNVAKILDILRNREVPGAFFVLEHLISCHPELILRMRDEGHTVCNHTARHPDMTTMPTEAEFAAELRALEEAYTALTGDAMPKYYRPPEGRFNRANMEWAEALGYKTIFWSFAYADWDNSRQPDPAEAKARILDNIHNGAVILLHPTSAANAAILGEVIDTLKADGWRFGTLDELTAAAG